MDAPVGVERIRNQYQVTTKASATSSWTNSPAVCLTSATEAAMPANARTREPIAEARYRRGGAQIIWRTDIQVDTIVTALYPQ